LLASLAELSLRSSLFAIVIPAVVALGLRLTGHSITDGGEHGDLSFPALSVAIGSFVLIPMLAMTGAATALMIVLHHLWYGRGSIWRAAFLLCLGAGALATAYAYDTVVIPAVT
jgi:hypothetical protein